MQKLPLSFYLRTNVVTIAKELIGKILVANRNGEYTSGRIVETEAYAGEKDKASHASKGRTARTDVMYQQGGRLYVYLCYGIHQMVNIVTNKEGSPDAVLIRGIEPVDGIDIMLKRMGKKKMDESITKGPGNVGKAFGFHTSQCGLSLISDELFIADDGFKISKSMIGTSCRIGVAYAGKHADWQYRFFIKGNKFVSGKIR